MTRELIGAAVEIAIAQNDAASDDCIIRREADAGFLEKMTEPLPLSPADCIARMLAYDTLSAAEAADSVQIRLPLCERAQLYDRLLSSPSSANASCCAGDSIATAPERTSSVAKVIMLDIILSFILKW
jgi:hypothetical protein